LEAEAEAEAEAVVVGMRMLKTMTERPTAMTTQDCLRTRTKRHSPSLGWGEIVLSREVALKQ